MHRIFMVLANPSNTVFRVYSKCVGRNLHTLGYETAAAFEGGEV